jgi:hypothetical protein
MPWRKVEIGELLLLEKGHEMQQIVDVGRQRVGRTSPSTQVPQEANYSGNGLAVIIKQLRGFVMDIVPAELRRSVETPSHSRKPSISLNPRGSNFAVASTNWNRSAALLVTPAKKYATSWQPWKGCTSHSFRSSTCVNGQVRSTSG